MDVPYLLRNNKKSRFGISTGIGYDAGVCQEVLATPLKKVFNRLGLGKLIYLFIALKQLIFINPGKMTVTLDGENTFSYDHVYFTAVMNQKYEGGGFKSVSYTHLHRLSGICQYRQVRSEEVRRPEGYVYG